MMNYLARTKSHGKKLLYLKYYSFRQDLEHFIYQRAEIYATTNPSLWASLSNTKY